MTFVAVVFTSIELFGWIYHPQYNSEMYSEYISADEQVVYDIGPGDFLPTFAVTTVLNGEQ